MTIPFTCPQCGTQTEVDPRYAGQSGPCSQCGEIITVPVPSGAGRDSSSANNSTGMVLVILGVFALVILLMCAGVGAYLLIPSVAVSKASAQRVICQNNLKQITTAMQMYHAEHGEFPPAYVADEDGRPLYSWRVLLLPYLELDGLYQEFDKSQAWDSPSNRMLTNNTFLSIYHCPSSPQQNNTETSYMMVVGPDALSEGANTTNIASISDGVSGTIHIVEVANSSIHWAEPRDLRADEITFGINDGTARGISSHHPGGANAAMCDTSVHFLRDTTDPKQVEAMTTINGGEVVSVP